MSKSMSSYDKTCCEYPVKGYNPYMKQGKTTVCVVGDAEITKGVHNLIGSPKEPEIKPSSKIFSVRHYGNLKSKNK